VKGIRNPKAFGVAPPGNEPAGIVSIPLRTVTAPAPMLLAKVVLSEPGGKFEGLATMS
jgi:hypothetical protein